MRKNFFKILLLILPIILFGCSGKTDSSGSLDIFETDQTEEAGQLIGQANEKLQEIKRILKLNESRLEDLKTALGEKNPKNVKDISEQLINQINLGTKLGQEALAKIDEAQRLNINDDFKAYLSLKERSLLKYADAYEERRNLAILLHDKYDPNNAEQRKNVGNEFERREVIFLNLMKEAGKLSDEANELAKEANSRKKQDN